MRRFSVLVGHNFDAGSPQEPNAAFDGEQQEYLSNLVPLRTEIGSVSVPATLVFVNIVGVKKYVRTNSCLNYTCDQFQQARQASGNFSIISSQENGDISVVLRIADRQSKFYYLLLVYPARFSAWFNVIYYNAISTFDLPRNESRSLSPLLKSAPAEEQLEAAAIASGT